jgi:hypothetical protein
MTRFLAAAMALALLACGCSMPADTSVAERAVPLFHADVEAGRFDEIYDKSDDELKKVATRKEFVDFLDAVHRKLGNTKTSEKTGWRMNYQMSGSFVTLAYATTFDAGSAHEVFVFRLDGQKAILVGYQINSMALVLK